MALGTEGSFIEEFGARQELQVVRPAQIDGLWDTIITAGGLSAVDTATKITDITTIDAPENKVMRVEGVGTLLVLRCGHDGMTVGPTVQVFGRFAANKNVGLTAGEPWQNLYSKAGTVTQALTVATSELSFGGLSYTAPDPEVDVFDLLGCNQILVGLVVLQTGGSAANTILQGKVI